MFGDLLQLRLVLAKYIFEAPSSENLALSFTLRSLCDLFTNIELRYNHRQDNHREYAEVLGRIRYGLKANSSLETTLS